MSTRDEILAKIKVAREAKNQEIVLPEAPVASGLKVPKGDLALAFKKSIESVQGECYISDNLNDCISGVEDFLFENNISSNLFLSPSLDKTIVDSLESSKGDISKIEAGITSCELLAAQTGTAILTAKEGRKLMGLSPIHVIIAKRDQLRPTLDEAVKEIGEKYGNNFPSQLTLITGPSRTADIEKTLILGAHGPKKLAVFIY